MSTADQFPPLLLATTPQSQDMNPSTYLQHDHLYDTSVSASLPTSHPSLYRCHMVLGEQQQPQPGDWSATTHPQQRFSPPRGHYQFPTTKPGSQIRFLKGDEIKEAYRMEKASYPEDEAASLDDLRYRQSEAPDLFLGYFEGTDFIGFITGMRYHESHITHDAFRVHIPTGESVCIHSVVVDERRRRQGIGLTLLQAFISCVQRTQQGASRILLLSHADKLPFYTRAGFTLLGPSAIKHGEKTWYECELSL